MRNQKDTERASRMGIGRRVRATILTAALAGVAIGAAGRALAQPEPPRFEAHVLERVEPRNGFDDYGYSIHAMADDGTVYGTVYNRQQNRFKAIRARVGEGTTWLLPRDPGVVELRPIAPSISGAVLLTIAPGYDYIYVPGHGIRRLNNLHPEWFFVNDMNNSHVLVGLVAPSPNNRAVVYRHAQGFEILHEAKSSAMAINDAGSVVGHLDAGIGWINVRIWHADGRTSTFTLPRSSTTPIGAVSINSSDEVVGMHMRRDSTSDSRWAGWFWSERTGLVEIPFRYIYPEGGFDVQIYGISDDGWVLGEEHLRGTRGQDYFLWHVDAGFFDLGDLYDWQSRFAYPADGHGGAVNADGQMTIPTTSLNGRGVILFLNPTQQ